MVRFLEKGGSQISEKKSRNSFQDFLFSILTIRRKFVWSISTKHQEPQEWAKKNREQEENFGPHSWGNKLKIKLRFWGEKRWKFLLFLPSFSAPPPSPTSLSGLTHTSSVHYIDSLSHDHPNAVINVLDQDATAIHPTAVETLHLETTQDDFSRIDLKVAEKMISNWRKISSSGLAATKLASGSRISSNWSL